MHYAVISNLKIAALVAQKGSNYFSGNRNSETRPFVREFLDGRCVKVAFESLTEVSELFNQVFVTEKVIYGFRKQFRMSNNRPRLERG